MCMYCDADGATVSVPEAIENFRKGQAAFGHEAFAGKNLVHVRGSEAVKPRVELRRIGARKTERVDASNHVPLESIGADELIDSFLLGFGDAIERDLAGGRVKETERAERGSGRVAVAGAVAIRELVEIVAPFGQDGVAVAEVIAVETLHEGKVESSRQSLFPRFPHNRHGQAIVVRWKVQSGSLAAIPRRRKANPRERLNFGFVFGVGIK